MSSAAQYNININKEADFVRSFQIKEDSVVKNITGHTFAAQIRSHHTDSDSTAFTCTIENAAQGLVQITLTDTQTSALEAGTQYWDLVMTDDGGSKTRLVEGKAFVKAGITR